MDRAIKRFRGFGLPLVIGEFNYSVFPCQQEVDLAGALLNIETAAQFLCGGGDAAYFYSYEPNSINQIFGSWGNHIMLLKNDSGAVPLSGFHAMRLLTSEWLDPLGGRHVVLPVNLHGAVQSNLLSLFALKRPDGSLSILVINKDPKRPVNLVVKGMGKAPCTLTTYSSEEYRWKPDGANGRPSRNLPPSARGVTLDQPVTILPWSIAVLRTP